MTPTIPIKAEMKPDDYERWQCVVCGSCQYATDLDDQDRCPRMLLRVYQTYSDLPAKVECVNYFPRNED